MRMNEEVRQVFLELVVIAEHHWSIMERKATPGDFVTHEQLRRERLVLNRAAFELEQADKRPQR